MRLKDFFFSTLPRSRKWKRKQSKDSTPPTDDVSGSPETDDVIIRNHNLRIDAINANGDRNSSRASGLGCSAPAQISYNHQLVSADFRYYSDSNSNRYSGQFAIQTLSKTPSNASESGFESGYDQHSSFHDGLAPDRFPPEHAPADRQPEVLTETFNTFPRERTRIKTNPWVTTHSGTMTSSVHGQIGGHVRAASPYSVAPSCLYTDSHNSRDSSSCSSVAADSSIPDSPLADHVTEPYESCDVRGDGIVEGGDLVINLNTGDIYVKPKAVFAPISFQYEDDLDATLERDIGRQRVKSRRKRDDRKCFYLTQEDLNAGQEVAPQDSDDDDGEFLANYTGSIVADSDSDNGDDSTLTRDQSSLQWSYKAGPKPINRRRGNKPRKYRMDAILRQEYNSQPMAYSPYESRDQDNSATCIGCQASGEKEIQPKECTDSAYDSSTLSSLTGSSGVDRYDPVEYFRRWPVTLPGAAQRIQKARKSEASARRSLEAIQNSLKVKVDRLKAEKRVVDEKVKQAREEEELRREEKTRIEQEVTSVRKQVLLQTLQDLKVNLEDQSRRLQEAYDDVIDMQWVNARLRRLRNTTL